MKIIKQLFWIFLFSFIGEFLSILLANFIPIPGSVLGMILLFFALHFNFLELSAVDEVGSWLTENMAIFFVPAGVGLMTNFGVLADFWLELFIIVFVTTAIMIGFIGFIVQKINTRLKSTDKINRLKEVEEND